MTSPPWLNLFKVSLSNVLCMGKGNKEPIQHIIDHKQQFPRDIKTQPSVSTGDVSFCRERNCKFGIFAPNRAFPKASLFLSSIINNYSPKAKLILLNNSRDEVERIIQQY